MEFQAKIIFTCIIVLTGIGVSLIDPNANNAGPDSFWVGGRKDLFRNMLCRSDGSFRRYTKIGILIWFAVFLAGIWLIA